MTRWFAKKGGTREDETSFIEETLAISPSFGSRGQKKRGAGDTLGHGARIV